MDNYVNSLTKWDNIEFEWDCYIYNFTDWDYINCDNLEYFTINEFYKDLEFWDNQLFKDWKQVDYMNTAVANMKTETQKKIIEKKEYNKMLEKRQTAMLESLQRVKNAKKYTFINSRMLFMLDEEITPEIQEQEQQFLINNQD